MSSLLTTRTSPIITITTRGHHNPLYGYQTHWKSCFDPILSVEVSTTIPPLQDPPLHDLSDACPWFPSPQKGTMSSPIPSTISTMLSIWIWIHSWTPPFKSSSHPPLLLYWGFGPPQWSPLAPLPPPPLLPPPPHPVLLPVLPIIFQKRTSMSLSESLSSECCCDPLPNTLQPSPSQWPPLHGCNEISWNTFLVRHPHTLRRKQRIKRESEQGRHFLRFHD